MTSCTAAVVVKDRREEMQRCLEGLRAQRRRPDEVVLIDNASTDGTYELLLEEQQHWDVPVVVRRVEGSIGRARNAAVELASADVIAFTDSDCVPTPEWLDELLGAATPDVACVQGRTLPDPGVERRRWAATQNLPEFTQRFETCNIAYRVDALRAAGGFDEAIGFFGEDTAAGWRVVRAGGRAVFAETALVHHDVTQPGFAWHLRRALRYQSWPRLVRDYPELREAALYHRFFLRRRSALFSLLVLGLLVGWRRPVALLLTLPYLRMRAPRKPTPHAVRVSVEATIHDATVFSALVYGSVRERTLVL